MRLLLLACSLCLIVWRVNGYCDQRFTNGCSNYGMLRRFEGIFTPSCDSHDVCYDCGAKFRYTRRGCDRTFHNNLLRACRSNFASDPRIRKKCEKHANLYKAAIELNSLGRQSI
ncbi:conodipine-P1-like [Littorina saxatilis]|uniref:conodipine-P1-like n=1 Tax=Littorina saxatilis TaxID=31220 RepID=UPI0038B49671